MFDEIADLSTGACCEGRSAASYVGDYSFLEVPLRLSSNSEEFLRHFDLFFGRFQARRPGDGAVNFQVRINHADPQSKGEHHLYQNGELIYKTWDYIDIFLFLEWQICGLVIKTDRYLLIHAALAAMEGAGVLIAGPSGAGKTTLVAGLALRDYDYVTDEIVVVDPETGGVLPFPRTLNLTARALSGSPALLKRLSEKSYGQKQPYLGERWFVEAGPGRGISRIRTVLFPAFEGTAEPAIEEVSRGTGLFLLTKNIFNLPLFQEKGIDLLMQMTKGARFYRMRTGNLDATLNLVEGTLSGE